MKSQNDRSQSTQFLGALVCFLAFLGIFGCKRPKDPFLDLADAKSKVMQVDDLNRAMELVFSEQSYNQKEFEDKVGVSLNRWREKLLATDIVAGGENREWQPDEAIVGLVEANRNLEVVSRTIRPFFVGSDAFYLRMCAWENRLADRICRFTPMSAIEMYRLAAKVEEVEAEEPSNGIKRVFQALYPDLNEADVTKLSESALLFDWVIRNVQLETPYAVPAEQLEAEKLNLNPSEDVAVNGVRGLGYNRFRWQLLYLGRGDYVERARLIIGLCRQRGLDAAMLMVNGNPWAVGVKINGQIYLFDTRLGMAIPSATMGKIATLSECRENPKVLDSLDLAVDESTRDDNKYWVKSPELANVSAKLMVSPESVSRRMWLLQSRLIGDFQIPIADNASQLLKDWAGIAGVTPELWDIEYRTHQFRAALRTAITQSAYDDTLMSKIIWYFQEEAYIDGFAQYRTARDLFVLGRFESDRTSNRWNAIESFYNLIYSDKTIDTLSLNRNLLSRLGILQEKGQSAAEFQGRLRDVQNQMRLVRRDAGVFLAQSHYDNGNPNAAARWLQRMRDRDDTSRWVPTIEYLLGRTGEARREYAEAITFWKKSSSEQFHGDLLRARLLSQLMPTTDP